MFTLFLDDSGTRPTHHVAVAAALIIPTSQIIRLEKEWKTFSEKEEFKFFHASPCNAKDEDSEFAEWSEKKVDRVFTRVRQISKKYGVVAISAAINKEYYDEVMPAELRQYTGTYHYTWCVNYAIAYAEKWRNRSDRIIPPFQYVFDKMEPKDPARKEIKTVMGYCERAAREQGRQGEYADYDFLSKKDNPGLQCADAISWVCNRFALHSFLEISLPKRAKVGWEDYGGPLADNGWLHAFTFERRSLQKFVATEQSNGGTMERLRRWEEEDKQT
jgi:hypothetical protein